MPTKCPALQKSIVRRLALVAGVSMLLVNPLWATCQCDQYRQFISLQNSVEQISTIMRASTNEEWSHLRNISDNPLIPRECQGLFMREQGFDKTQLEIVLRLRGPKSAVFSAPKTETGASTLSKAFDDLYRKFRSACAAMPDLTLRRQCYRNTAKEDYRRFGEWLMTAADKDILGGYAGSLEGTIESNAKVLRLYYASLGKTEKQLIDESRNKAGGLNDNEYLNFIQLIGGQAARGYDREQAAQSAKLTGGKVSGDAILAAAQVNAEIGLEVIPEGDHPADLVKRAGVCRDIASLQGRLLKARNFATQLISFTTLSGQHVTVIAQDRHSPLKTHLFDYSDRVIKKDIDGSRLVYQGARDLSLTYRIYEPSGRQLANMRSEFGKVAAETTGFDLRKEDPLAEATGSVIAAQLRTGSPKHPQQARVFVARDGNGAEYLGVAWDYRHGLDGDFPGQIGTSLGIQSRPDHTEVPYIYAQADQHWAPKIRAAKGVIVTPDTSLSATGAATAAQIDGKTTWNGQGDARLGVELRVDHKGSARKYAGSYRVGASISPALANVQDMSSVTVAPNSVYAGTEQQLIVGETKVFADAIAVMDQISTRIRMGVGAASRQISGEIHYSGRLTNDSALLQDSSIRRVGASMQYRLSPASLIGGTIEIPVEGDVAGHPEVTGNYKGNF